jgi:hypothetical protein
MIYTLRDRDGKRRFGWNSHILPPLTKGYKRTLKIIIQPIPVYGADRRFFGKVRPILLGEETDEWVRWIKDRNTRRAWNHLHSKGGAPIIEKRGRYFLTSCVYSSNMVNVIDEGNLFAEIAGFTLGYGTPDESTEELLGEGLMQIASYINAKGSVTFTLNRERHYLPVIKPNTGHAFIPISALKK